MTIKEGIESNESNEVDKNNKLWHEQQKLIRNAIKTLDGEIIEEKESNNLEEIIEKIKKKVSNEQNKQKNESNNLKKKKNKNKKKNIFK